MAGPIPAASQCLLAVMIVLIFPIGTGRAMTPSNLPFMPTGDTTHAVGVSSCG